MAHREVNCLIKDTRLISGMQSVITDTIRKIVFVDEFFMYSDS